MTDKKMDQLSAYRELYQVTKRISDQSGIDPADLLEFVARQFRKNSPSSGKDNDNIAKMAEAAIRTYTGLPMFEK